MNYYEQKALMYCEDKGISEYLVNGEWLEYWSFFPGEGFRFIRRNLDTNEEVRDGFIPWDKRDGRPVPAFLKEVDANNEALWWCKYNYNIG